MPKQNVLIAALNRGRISKYALARDDLQGNRIRFGAEIQTNIIPRVLGSSMLRPGTEYVNATAANAKPFGIPFIYNATDTAILEVTEDTLRVEVSETLVTRASVSTTIADGDMSSATGWTDADEGTAASTFSGGKMNLLGTGFAAAIRKQTVTVSGGDQNTEHALRIVVDRGPVTLRVGSSDGADDYIAETDLGTGTHSLAFTPTGNFYLQFSSLKSYTVVVDSCTVESSGVMTLPVPYQEEDLQSLRYEQSGDVVYIRCDGYQPRKVERRGTGSWSVALYEPIDGPYRSENISPIKLTPSAITGDITLTASRSFFRSTHVGALFRLSSVGQLVEADISGEEQWSDYIHVTGTGTQRNFTYAVAGTWAGTVRIQRSIAEPGAWVDVTGWAWTANASGTLNDALSDQDVFYRIGIKTGEYTSDTAELQLSYGSGSITGDVRITGFTNATSVSAVVLKQLGGTAATDRWREGSWSDYRGWPQIGILYEERLWDFGNGRCFGSVSDGFETHDPTTEGDSGPINRSIPAAAASSIFWALPLSRLIIGSTLGEHTIRSSSLDEPLSPTLFNVKTPSKRGSSNVAARALGSTGVFIGRSGSTLYELKQSIEAGDFVTDDGGDLTQIVPEILEVGVTRIEVQFNPDIRIHCIRADGTAGILIKDPAEDVLCWIDYETDGLVEDVVILPGTVEDKVYYHIKRTINGNTVRYRERWAMESECRGEALSKCVDCHLVYDGVSTTTITGLDHLEGETVIIWGDGADMGTKTVASGSITLDEAVTKAVIGLTYTGKYKSVKLAYASALGTALLQRKRVNMLGLLLKDAHYQGVQYGPDFNTLDDMPHQKPDGSMASEGTIYDEYDLDMSEFPGDWSTDSRICLQMQAPRPCTVLGFVFGIQTHDKG